MICKKKPLKKIFTVVSLGVLLNSMSCSLPEEDENFKLEPATLSSINNEMYKELNKISLSDYKENVAVHYEINYRADLSAVVKLEDTLRYIYSMDLNETETELKIVLKEDKITWDGNQKVDEKFSDVIWRLNVTPEQFSPMLKKAVEEEIIKTQSLSMADDEPKEEITYEYYNLRSKEVTVPAPILAAGRPDCGGLENCEIHGQEISYFVRVKQGDQILINAEQSTVISADVPALFLFDEDYILPVYSDCLSRPIDKYYVRSCIILRDLQK